MEYIQLGGCSWSKSIKSHNLNPENHRRWWEVGVHGIHKESPIRRLFYLFKERVSRLEHISDTAWFIRNKICERELTHCKDLTPEQVMTVLSLARECQDSGVGETQKGYKCVGTDLLSLKVRAIAKHATALADELDEIDKVKCSKCGSAMEWYELSYEGTTERSYVCKQCGHSYME